MNLPEIDAHDVARKLSEAIQHRTISYPTGYDETKLNESRKAFVAFRDWVSRTYPAFSAVAKREVVGDYSLLFTWQGTDASLDPVLLMAHMDVVPLDPLSESDWLHPPFAGVIAEDQVWGRGALDMKGALVTQLEAAERLIQDGYQPRRTILFAFGHDEENGGLEGNRRIADLLASRGVRLFFSSDEGGGLAGPIFPGVAQDIAVVGVAEKGLLVVELTTRGDGGHASAPLPFEHLAIGKLVTVLKRLGRLRFRNAMARPTEWMLEELAPDSGPVQRMLYKHMRLSRPFLTQLMGHVEASSAMFHTTMAPTVVAGGLKENSLPVEARAVLNLRLHFVDTVKGVLERIRRVAGKLAEVRVLEPAREASPIANVDGEAYRLLKATIEQAKPGVLVVPYLVSACTDSVYFQALTDNVFRFTPLPIGPGELILIHGNNERVGIPQLGTAVTFYMRLIRTAGDSRPTDTDMAQPGR
ncbi:M20/M25/M40 family metallo-hydrolase [Myxococcus sp. Y35]|uniref:M20/M25/M40 family metallo-hydrolase n=1 Tax=Pseudomyxococcus flavus TaxID=3115648 RepID=UPI003CEBC532